MSYLDWKAGDKVVCINAGDPSYSGRGWVPGEELVVDNVYTIKRILIDDAGDLVLHLHEVERSQFSKSVFGDEAGYAVFRFRRVQPRKTSIAIFQRLLDNPRVRISEDA